MTREELAKMLMDISEQEGSGVFQETDGTISFNGFNQTTYSNYLKNKGLPSKDVRGITVGESLDILNEEFIQRHGISNLPHDVLPLVLDMSFNSGPNNAALMVQRVVGAEEDGIIGPKTMKKYNKFIKDGDFINSFSDARRDFLVDSNEESVIDNRNGLLQRVERVRQREIGRQATSGVTTK
jgi:lysozyme family protein